MKATILVIIGALALSMLVPTSAAAKDKKKPPRGMIESMQSLPCGVKQKGLNGLGAVWGSVGVTSMSSNEKLCPQYLFRTDDLEYHIRPKDTKHAVILPIGHEAEFRIKKDEIFLKVPEGGDHKTRAYHVISMEPIRTANAEDGSYGRPAGGSTAEPPASTPTSQPTPSPSTVRSQDTLPQRTPPPPANQTPAPPQ